MEWNDIFKNTVARAADIELTKRLNPAAPVAATHAPNNAITSPGNDGQPIKQKIDERVWIALGVVVAAALIYKLVK